MAHTHDHTKEMSQEMHNIIEHARALVEATSGELDDRIQSARAALKERLDSTRDEYGELEERVKEKVQVADDFIHVKPYYAVGGALIAGLFMGWFMSRK